MAELLSPGQKIQTLFGGSICVKKFLAECGQWQVYIVDCNGKEKALKWYKTSSLGENPQAFYENIRENIAKGTPGPEFLWPQDITQWHDGSFGYVMELRPEGCYDLSEFMLCHMRFSSYRTVIDAALSIVSAFMRLHSGGYLFHSVNEYNFFINPQNGQVFICGDNGILKEGQIPDTLGNPRYMAPEIVTHKSMPNSLTDRFSMAVILYILFCLNHPLEGKRYLAAALTPQMQDQLYGTEPIFMMDPQDKRNEPHPTTHKNSLMVWPCLPDYIQEIFIGAFSKKAFEHPSARPSEINWLHVLTRFRSDIVLCSCGNEVFTKNGTGCSCDACGKKLIISHRLALKDYSIPVGKDARIYRCQLGICDETKALQPVAQIVKKRDAELYGVRNKTNQRWDAVTSKGDHRKVAPEEVVPVKDGIVLKIADQLIEIKAN